MAEQFIGEEMAPAAGTADVEEMTRRAPGLPERFCWRGREYRIAGVIKRWKSHGPCKSGSGETYLRRHWYQVLTAPPAIMTVYFERQVQNRKRPKARWWIYTIQPVERSGPRQP